MAEFVFHYLHFQTDEATKMACFYVSFTQLQSGMISLLSV